MSALMRGLNRVHGCEETRSFARQRATAVGLLAWSLLAVVVSFVLLVLGRAASRRRSARRSTRRPWSAGSGGAPSGRSSPPLLAVAVAGILRLGPARTRPRRAAPRRPGRRVAVLDLGRRLGAASASTSRASPDYGAAWGSLSAVIVMLTWLWLTAVALLLGAQVEAEVERRAG